MISSPDWSRWHSLLDMPLPEWLRVEQLFSSEAEPDVAAAVRRELARPDIAPLLRPGFSVALGVGSRGLASLVPIVKTTVRVLREQGCEPFIVPAMGSHAGGTAEGQTELLAGYGITEAKVGAPIHASMETVSLGRLGSGLPVYFDKLALAADLIVPINRIKAHTSFKADIESGLSKMLAVGFGNHRGARSLHSQGYANFAANLVEARKLILKKTPFVFGLATVENAHHQVAHLEAVRATELSEREPELLELAHSLMPRLQFEALDILCVYEAGKDISGLGMDPNVTGRYTSPIAGTLSVNKLVLFNLTRESKGNAIGLGMADITTEKVMKRLDLEATWLNAVTSTNVQAARLPLFMPTDETALKLALKTCGQPDLDKLRAVWIKNTSELSHIYLTKALLSEVWENRAFQLLGEEEPIPFAAGSLRWPGEPSRRPEN